MLKVSNFVPRTNFMVFVLMTVCTVPLLSGCNDDDDKTTIEPTSSVEAASQSTVIDQPASGTKPPALDCAPR